MCSSDLEETPGAFYANQYHNPSNPLGHYLSTAPEIWEQMEGRIDVFVGGLGTGGTIAKVDADTLSFLLTSASSTGNQYLDGPMLATVTGTVSSDLNGNGTADAGEARGAGITVTLTRTGSGTYAGYKIGRAHV